MSSTTRLGAISIPGTKPSMTLGSAYSSLPIPAPIETPDTEVRIVSTRFLTRSSGISSVYRH